MDESTKNSPCKACDVGADEVQLHAELQHLRQHLAERDAHIVALEGEFIKCTSRSNDLEEQLGIWTEKYERLYDSHKRVQKLNQVLEEKLLQMVDKMKGEKSQLTKDIATLSVRLAESKHNYSMLQKENERYKNDMNLAIQLLQCKPDNFVSQKLDNLPVDTQARVSQYVMSKTSKPSSTSHSKCGNENDTFDASEYEFNISASLMSKILEDSIQDTVTKHCDSCTCSKKQNKPFCYNESYYSIATQTQLSGEMKKSLCNNCKSEIQSLHSDMSARSSSPRVIKLVNEKPLNCGLTGPMYIIPQPVIETFEEIPEVLPETTDISYAAPDNNLPDNNAMIKHINDKSTLDQTSPKEVVIDIKKKSCANMEPSVHHKLCDRTKTPISSKKSSVQSVVNDDLLVKDPLPNVIPLPKIKAEIQAVDTIKTRKSSHGSMSAMSRTSSVAKSTVSTHKSNTQVGPGPRFCHLRMQAGSKNILLDNAEPDVPPVLYRRQSKCNDNTLFKDLHDDFVELDKNEDDEMISDIKNDNVVVETTLIDVHVDNNNKESNTSVKTALLNPVLLNVSSSPLQPLKTHNFSQNSENNNNSHSLDSQQNATEIDNLLNDFNADVINKQNNNQDTDRSKKPDVFTPTDNHEIKIFNFDRYEQNKLQGQYNRPLRKIDMSQLHYIENTRISKDFPPLGDCPKLEKKPEVPPKTSLPAVVNVYPNLTQTHLKVNESKKVFTNEQSTSSLSSDDSAALLQKQQLLRVAEWVEKNLEQQNNLNDPLEDDVNFNSRATRRDSKLTRLTETLNEIALNMPHPVSKFARQYSKDSTNAWVHNNITSILGQDKGIRKNVSSHKVANNVAKETMFPVESGDATITEVSKEVDRNPVKSSHEEIDVGKALHAGIKTNGDREITPEDLARMEYNVKKFLLSGPHWVNPMAAGRSRRTSSKTETDV